MSTHSRKTWLAAVALHRRLWTDISESMSCMSRVQRKISLGCERPSPRVRTAKLLYGNIPLHDRKVTTFGNPKRPSKFGTRRNILARRSNTHTSKRHKRSISGRLRDP
ncbi:hypothetical protein BJY04DRAFT_192393 [Aspergillus karnatakaensis]|uniref:uncharacterized protein n=1 Tax=Aspergillus karnatakaensis TaxID=1810916 RepID=UPI003CCD9AAF